MTRIPQDPHDFHDYIVDTVVFEVADLPITDPHGIQHLVTMLESESVASMVSRLSDSGGWANAVVQLLRATGIREQRNHLAYDAAKLQSRENLGVPVGAGQRLSDRSYFVQDRPSKETPEVMHRRNFTTL